MQTTTIFICLVVGLTAGVLSGLVGLGGGSIVIPALIWILGMTQQQAQGTTLAMMVPPIGILAAYTYWRAGHVNLPVAGLTCIGFVIGGLIGARFAVASSNEILQRVFAVALIAVGLEMLLK